jgi:hypothetical protein
MESTNKYFAWTSLQVSRGDIVSANDSMLPDPHGRDDSKHIEKIPRDIAFRDKLL